MMPLLWLLLLVLLAGRGLSVCRLQGLAQPAELAQDGDLVIGGIFSFRTGQDYVINTFQRIPEKRQCKKYERVHFHILHVLFVPFGMRLKHW